MAAAGQCRRHAVTSRRVDVACRRHAPTVDIGRRPSCRRARLARACGRNVRTCDSGGARETRRCVTRGSRTWRYATGDGRRSSRRRRQASVTERRRMRRLRPCSRLHPLSSARSAGIADWRYGECDCWTTTTHELHIKVHTTKASWLYVLPPGDQKLKLKLKQESIGHGLIHAKTTYLMQYSKLHNYVAAKPTTLQIKCTSQVHRFNIGFPIPVAKLSLQNFMKTCILTYRTELNGRAWGRGRWSQLPVLRGHSTVLLLRGRPRSHRVGTSLRPAFLAGGRGMCRGRGEDWWWWGGWQRRSGGRTPLHPLSHPLPSPHPWG